MSKSFDPACYHLAELFLPDDASQEQKRELAGRLQETAEDYLSELEGTGEPTPGAPTGTHPIPLDVQKSLQNIKAFTSAVRKFQGRK